MDRNHSDDHWRLCHWKAWRENTVRWDQHGNTSKEHSQECLGATGSARVSEIAGIDRLSFSNGARYTAFGSWSGGAFVRPFFPGNQRCKRI